jgi:ATP-dependent helicase HrpB
VQAPPGAGKSTGLPLALLEQQAKCLSGGKKIVMLQPRRVAARAVAHRMASLLREPVGRHVGAPPLLPSTDTAAGGPILLLSVIHNLIH